MFEEIGIFIDGIISNIFKWNRKRPWYKTYCYLTSRKYSIKNIERLYRGGYLTEKHFIKLSKKRLSETQIQDIITKHKINQEQIKNYKL